MFQQREEVIKEGRLFDVYNRIVPTHRKPKTIINTGPDYVISVHEIVNGNTHIVDKNTLQLAHYRKRWLNGTYYVDNRMKQFTPMMMKKMKEVRIEFEEYMNNTK